MEFGLHVGDRQNVPGIPPCTTYLSSSASPVPPPDFIFGTLEPVVVARMLDMLACHVTPPRFSVVWLCWRMTSSSRHSPSFVSLLCSALLCLVTTYT